MPVRSQSLKTITPPGAKCRPNRVEQRLAERLGNMVQYIAQNHEIVSARLRGGDVLHRALDEPDTLARSPVQTPKARRQVDAGDVGVRVQGAQPLGDGAFAAAYLQDLARIGLPALNVRGKVADIEKDRPVRIADLALVLAEHAADHRPDRHGQKAPVSFARTRGTTRSTIRESRR